MSNPEEVMLSGLVNEKFNSIEHKSIIRSIKDFIMNNNSCMKLNKNKNKKLYQDPTTEVKSRNYDQHSSLIQYYIEIEIVITCETIQKW